MVTPPLAHLVASASRAEETGEWRHPHDLAGLLAPIQSGEGRSRTKEEVSFAGDADVEALAWVVLSDDPVEIVARFDGALERGATFEQLARAVAYAAALRLVRFHTQNDHGDWDAVHHGFTAASATHQMIRRAPSLELARGIYQAAMKVFLDRFLNVPAARLPAHEPGIPGGAPTWLSSKPAGTARAWSTKPALSSTGGCGPVGSRRLWWRRSAQRC